MEELLLDQFHLTYKEALEARKRLIPAYRGNERTIVVRNITEPRETVSMDHAAEIIGVTRRTIYKLMNCFRS